MQKQLLEKFLSRAFLLTVATAVAAWCEGRTQEAIYLIIAYVIGDRAVSASQALRK